MSDLVEGIKLLGGIAGLGTAAFTIYDRLVKHRPIASITAKADPYDGDGDAFLKVINRSDREIVLIKIESRPPIAQALVRTDIRSTIERALGIDYARLIRPGEVAEFPIRFKYDDRATLQHSLEVLRFDIHWYRAGGPTWLQGMPLRVRIRAQDLHRILVDAQRRGVERERSLIVET